MPSSHSLSTRALHTIVDGHALHCRCCKVMYPLRCDQTAMPFRKTDGTAPGFKRRLHRWSETTSFRFCFAQCCCPYVHSRCEKDMKVVVALSSFILFDFVSEGMDSNKHARKYRKLFVSDHQCKLHLKPIAPFHQSSRRL